jgi:ComF family protein
MGDNWALALKNVFFPQFCKCCGVRLLTEENGYFCPSCWASSPRVARPLCGKPHSAMVGLGTLSNFPCAPCRERPNKYVRRIYGAVRYEEAMEIAIKLMKFQDKERLLEPLGDEMISFAKAEMPCDEYDLLVPVPLHTVRLRSRGFNQSGLLARYILRAFPNAQFDEGLKRIRPTRTQIRLKGKARLSNVRGAFALVGAPITGKRVLLVDDVVTSGGTVTECARALHRGKAASVDVFTAALVASGPSRRS